jgi:hypothetical protein
MRSKTEQIQAAWAAGDQIGALRIAAQFFDRSNETMIFKRGMDANNHPGFYRQLGKVPQELVAAALALLQKQFDRADRQPRIPDLLPYCPRRTCSWLVRPHALCPPLSLGVVRVF